MRSGWGDSLSPCAVPELRDHPTPSRIPLHSMRADPESELRSSRPLQGRVRKKAATKIRVQLPILVFKQQRAHILVLAARIARAVLKHLPPNTEGVGNAGCPMHPQPRVRMVVVDAHEYSQRVHRNRPAFPHAMVLRLIRALPGDRAFLPPSFLRSLLPRNLTPASGRQDHTTSPSASSALVLRRQSVHRIPPQRS